MPLNPLSTLCSISLLINDCSSKGSSNGCRLFLSFSFRSFNAKSTIDRPSPPIGMVVNPYSLFTICTAVLAQDSSLLCLEEFYLYVTTISILYTLSSLGCRSSVSRELAFVCSNFGVPLFPISSSSLKFS